MTKVRCSVNSCYYWGEGDVCKADSIWVNNNIIEERDDKMPHPYTEFAEEPGVFSKDQNRIDKPEKSSASNSSQTRCETMRPQKEQLLNKEEQ